MKTNLMVALLVASSAMAADGDLMLSTFSKTEFPLTADPPRTRNWPIRLASRWTARATCSSPITATAASAKFPQAGSSPRWRAMELAVSPAMADPPQARN